MATILQEFQRLRVHIDDVVYMPDLEAMPAKPHPFVYFISIHNDSPVPVTIRGRKWIITEASGEVSVIEGAGVVGETPTIEPGGHFSYNSYHIVAGNAQAQGAFFGETAEGNRFFSRIPAFTLTLPDWL
jgi:ApaG protein